jgi:hypothetical protein
MHERRFGIVALVLGGLAIFAVQRLAPLLGPPLYDGVIVVERYRWLVPPPGQAGDPKSASGTAQVKGGASPLIALATGEQPPQAQIFATPGAFVLPAGTSSIRMSIAAILPRTLPTDGHIAGNVYRISVADQAGLGLTAPASAKVTVVLRGPDNEPFVTIEQLTFEGWKPLKTEDAGFASTFLAVVTGFGDFALVAPGPGGSYPTATSGAAASGSPSGSGQASPAATGATSPSSPGASSLVSQTPSAVSGDAARTQGGPPTTAIAAVVALLILGAIGLASLRERDRRRRRYRAARPRRR